jgi:hypothetical protein
LTTEAGKDEGTLRDSTTHQATEKTIGTTKKEEQLHSTSPKESEQPGQAGRTTKREATSQALLRIWGYRAGQKNPGRVEEKFFL